MRKLSFSLKEEKNNRHMIKQVCKARDLNVSLYLPRLHSATCMDAAQHCLCLPNQVLFLFSLSHTQCKGYTILKLTMRML